jgi:putative CocE/NonD family hydrolase
MPRPTTILIAMAVAAGVTIAGHTPSSQPDVVADTTVRIPMRDGALLAAKTYQPATNGTPVSERLPVLLHRTPYALDGALVEQAEYFARHGYVAVLQNIRGRFESGGTFIKYDPTGAADGYDTIEWLAKQPYADGKVGMWGRSYAAHTQAEAAKLNPLALRALLLTQGGMANAWDHAVRHGGAFELGRELTWAWRSIETEAPTAMARAHAASENVTDWYSALPLRKGLSPLAASPEIEQYYFDELTRSDYGPYWKSMGLNWVDYYEQTADVPMLHVGSWYDIFLRGTIDNYVALSKMKTSPIAMLIGPWTHSGQTRTYSGDVDFGRDSAITDYDTAFQLRWFDVLLKGKPAPNDWSPIRIFVMGTGDGSKTAEGRLAHGGYWMNLPSWPPPQARATTFYFQADGSLQQTPPRSGPSSTTYTFDPLHPVPTIGGSTSARVNDGGYDQRERKDFPGSRPPYLPLRSRSDVVVFQTEPLDADVTVIGPVTVTLFASSAAVDTDFTAKLVDVYPPSESFPTGFDLNVTDALVRMRYRNGRHTQDLIEPGKVYEVTIRPFPTANVFKKGHRIRVDISSSNFPRFDVNPNTGEPLGMNRRWASTDNTVYHGGSYLSRIDLHIIR